MIFKYKKDGKDPLFIHKAVTLNQKTYKIRHFSNESIKTFYSFTRLKTRI